MRISECGMRNENQKYSKQRAESSKLIKKVIRTTMVSSLKT
jgi:hypothetical protein